MLTDFEHKGIQLVQTCIACPEQYDAYYEGAVVGYLRLRHGTFTVEYPDVRGKLVYAAAPEGDGIFISGEREKYLRKACKALKKEIEKCYISY